MNPGQLSCPEKVLVCVQVWGVQVSGSSEVCVCVWPLMVPGSYSNLPKQARPMEHITPEWVLGCVCGAQAHLRRVLGAWAPALWLGTQCPGCAAGGLGAVPRDWFGGLQESGPHSASLPGDILVRAGGQWLLPLWQYPSFWGVGDTRRAESPHLARDGRCPKGVLKG